MSNESYSTLAPSAGSRGVEEFLELVGYRYIKKEEGIRWFWWFDERNYRSFSGVSVGLRAGSKPISVYTRTNVARSYWDFEQQVRTVRLLRDYFGGHFETDEGRNRYWRGRPPLKSPVESGCHIAYERFGQSLIRAHLFLEARHYTKQQWQRAGVIAPFDAVNPRLLSNNMLLPFLVSILEEYFKSVFVAILRYSDVREGVFKDVRMPGDRLLSVSSGLGTIEASVAEQLSFQNVSAICRNLEKISPGLGLAAVLRKPYRRRRKTLFESLEQVIARRHRFIHQGESDVRFEDEDIGRAVDDVQAAVGRCHERLFRQYGWKVDQGWGVGTSAVELVRQSRARASTSR